MKAQRGAMLDSIEPLLPVHPIHDCPQYCHICPYMGNAIMPWCMGTIQSQDDLDLSNCCCVPGDPIRTRAQLAEYAWHLLYCLREKRRNRAVQSGLVKRLKEMAGFLKFARDLNDIRKAMAQIESLTGQIISQATHIVERETLPASETMLREEIAVMLRDLGLHERVTRLEKLLPAASVPPTPREP